jgi:hypothetical protein
VEFASTFVLILAGGVSAAPPAPAESAAHAPAQASVDSCRSQDPHDIVVCAQRGHGYRLDSNVMDARREAESRSRNATAALPLAQAVCSAAPSGCGNGLEGLDLVNVAFVAGTMAVKAAKGKDWTGALGTGGPDEYQLYLQAKREREQHEADRAAGQLRAAARARADR